MGAMSPFALMKGSNTYLQNAETVWNAEKRKQENGELDY